jgi:hypothetical protein
VLPLSSRSFLVTNNSVETDPLTITSVIDDKLGDLTAAAIAGNGGSAILLPGESFSFEFTSDIIVLDAGGTQTNIVTVVGVDDEGETATDDDNHIVTAENVAPLISIVKDGPAFINEGGEDVTFHITITNNSVETDPLTITSLEDDVFGNILAAAEEANGGVITLAAGDSFDFFFNPPGEIDLNAFETHTDVVTVVGTDDEGDTATAHDDHIITARDVLPVITIDKTGVLEVDEGGADVVFTFVITNTSTVDAVTLTSIDDDKLLSLLAIAEAKNGGPITLQPGESIDFEAPAFLVLLNAGGTFDNTVTVIGQDDDGNTADAVDTHTITARGIPGDIALVKTVDADGDGVFHDSEMVQAFGDSVTYKYEVTNASLFPLVDPLTIDDLTDDQGQFAGFDLMLNGALQAGVTLVKTGGDQDALLEKDETWTFTKTVNVNLNPGDNLINTATVTGADDEGSPVSDTDTAEVLAAVVGPGVRTPGFWGNLGLDFWDGDASIPKTGPNFPGHDLLYAVDSNNDGVINNLDEKGLLIGDYGLDGAAPDGLSTGQDTFFISLDDAHKIIDASQKESQDTRWVLARDEIATWLNYLAGNPIGDATDPNSPHTYLDEGIDWLQATSTNGSAADTFDSWSEGGAKVPASSPIWQQAIAGNVDSASEIHTQLDSYNNTGSTFDIVDVNGVPTKVFHMYASDAG